MTRLIVLLLAVQSLQGFASDFSDVAIRAFKESPEITGQQKLLARQGFGPLDSPRAVLDGDSCLGTEEFCSELYLVSESWAEPGQVTNLSGVFYLELTQGQITQQRFTPEFAEFSFGAWKSLSSSDSKLVMSNMRDVGILPTSEALGAEVLFAGRLACGRGLMPASCHYEVGQTQIDVGNATLRILKMMERLDANLTADLLRCTEVTAPRSRPKCEAYFVPAD